MSPSPYRVLETAVALHDEGVQPLTPTAVAERVEPTPETVERLFARFVDCELLLPTGDGYAPTVTARELLALDPAGDVLILDVDADAP